MPDYDPDTEQRRLTKERDAALNETLAALPPEDAARLQASVDAAAQVAPILEDHNYYIDQRVATLSRRLALAAGRRLVSIGELAAPEDVFYLRYHELRPALLGELTGVPAIVEQHRAGMEQWAKVTPPGFIGAPPPEPTGEEPPNRFWGGGNMRSDRPG
jgi:pyruvate,water dikinase